MKTIFSFMKPYRKEALISPLFKLLEAVFDLLVPLVIRQMIDVGIPSADKSYLFRMCGILVVFALIGLICAVTAQYFAAKAAVGFAANMRSELFRRILAFSDGQTDKAGTSTLITRMTSDVNQIQSGVNLTLRLLLRSPIIVLGSVIAAFTVNAKSALVFVVAVPLLAAVVFSIMWGCIPLYRKVQNKLDRVTALTRENLTGVRVIRAFRMEENEKARFARANDEHTGLQNFVGKISALMNPLTLLIVNLGVVALLASGAELVRVGEMTQGDVVAMTNYMAQILVELVKFATTVFSVNKALASAHRVEEILKTDVRENTVADPAPEDSGEAIVFDRVSLTYPGNAAPSLSGISFRVPKGSTLGVIGSTGSGKTSVANLIPRFYEATSGSVRVNGRDVRSYPASELRSRIAIVPQKAELFRGTIRSNLLWGKESASDEELWRALELAQAKSFVEERDGGLDAPVAQNGKNFSGGQRQRLTVARALVQDAEILILDDSSSALDYATDAALRSSLRALSNAPTTVIISQRTASIRHADRILVLDDGAAVGYGTHEELMKNCPVYREIHQSQFGKEDAV